MIKAIITVVQRKYFNINRYEFIEFNALNETYAGYIRIPKTINVLRLRPQ